MCPRLLRSSRLIVVALLVMFAHRTTRAQGLLTGEEIPEAAKQIGGHPHKNTLNFDEIYLTRLSKLRFDLRYHAGFLVRLPWSETPDGGKLRARIRVTPQKGTPVLLGEYFDIPAVSEALSKLPRELASSPIAASVSGDFVVGPGKYKVELLFFSPDNKTFFKKWTFKTEPDAGFAGLMKPETVSEAPQSRWAGKLYLDGIRLTLLLNATGTSASQARLWDSHFLLTMVSTVLGQLPCRSLRLVAFNLDQQVELFQRDGFTLEAWSDVESALQATEFSTIDYRNLLPNTPSEFLAHLVEQETSTPVDAVVLVGRRTHFLGKTPPQLKASLHTGAKLYYLRSDGPGYRMMITHPDVGVFSVESDKIPDLATPDGLGFVMNGYTDKQIPDSLTYLVRDLRGTVLPFGSSHEFGKAIEQLRSELFNPPLLSSSHSQFFEHGGIPQRAIRIHQLHERRYVSLGPGIAMSKYSFISASE